MSRTRLLLANLVMVAVGLSCSNPNEEDLPLRAPDLSSPIATGLLITTYDDPTIIAVWGQPSDLGSPPGISPYFPGGNYGGNLPTQYFFLTPYPNPFFVSSSHPSFNSLNMEFALPKESVVSLWIVRARWVGDPNTDVVSLSGGTVNAPNTLAVRQLIRHQDQDAGYHGVRWDGLDDQGNPVPTGFYRVYMEAGGYLLWHDVFLFYSADELPQNLRIFLLSRSNA